MVESISSSGVSMSFTRSSSISRTRGSFMIIRSRSLVLRTVLVCSSSVFHLVPGFRSMIVRATNHPEVKAAIHLDDDRQSNDPTLRSSDRTASYPQTTGYPETASQPIVVAADEPSSALKKGSTVSAPSGAPHRSRHEQSRRGERRKKSSANTAKRNKVDPFLLDDHGSSSPENRVGPSSFRESSSRSDEIPGSGDHVKTAGDAADAHDTPHGRKPKSFMRGGGFKIVSPSVSSMNGTVAQQLQSYEKMRRNALGKTSVLFEKYYSGFSSAGQNGSDSAPLVGGSSGSASDPRLVFDSYGANQAGGGIHEFYQNRSGYLSSDIDSIPGNVTNVVMINTDSEGEKGETPDEKPLTRRASNPLLQPAVSGRQNSEGSRRRTTLEEMECDLLAEDVDAVEVLRVRHLQLIPRWSGVAAQSKKNWHGIILKRFCKEYGKRRRFEVLCERYHNGPRRSLGSRSKGRMERTKLYDALTKVGSPSIKKAIETDAPRASVQTVQKIDHKFCMSAEDTPHMADVATVYMFCEISTNATGDGGTYVPIAVPNRGSLLPPADGGRAPGQNPAGKKDTVCAQQQTEHRTILTEKQLKILAHITLAYVNVVGKYSQGMNVFAGSLLSSVEFTHEEDYFWLLLHFLLDIKDNINIVNALPSDLLKPAVVPENALATEVPRHQVFPAEPLETPPIEEIRPLKSRTLKEGETHTSMMDVHADGIVGALRETTASLNVFHVQPGEATRGEVVHEEKRVLRQSSRSVSKESLYLESSEEPHEDSQESAESSLYSAESTESPERGDGRQDGREYDHLRTQEEDDDRMSMQDEEQREAEVADAAGLGLDRLFDATDHNMITRFRALFYAATLDEFVVDPHETYTSFINPDIDPKAFDEFGEGPSEAAITLEPMPTVAVRSVGRRSKPGKDSSRKDPNRKTKKKRSKGDLTKGDLTETGKNDLAETGCVPVHQEVSASQEAQQSQLSLSSCFAIEKKEDAGLARSSDSMSFGFSNDPLELDTMTKNSGSVKVKRERQLPTPTGGSGPIEMDTASERFTENIITAGANTTAGVNTNAPSISPNSLCGVRAAAALENAPKSSNETVRTESRGSGRKSSHSCSASTQDSIQNRPTEAMQPCGGPSNGPLQPSAGVTNAASQSGSPQIRCPSSMGPIPSPRRASALPVQNLETLYTDPFAAKSIVRAVNPSPSSSKSAEPYESSPGERDEIPEESTSFVCDSRLGNKDTRRMMPDENNGVPAGPAIFSIDDNSTEAVLPYKSFLSYNGDAVSGVSGFTIPSCHGFPLSGIGMGFAIG